MGLKLQYGLIFDIILYYIMYLFIYLFIYDATVLQFYKKQMKHLHIMLLNHIYGLV